mmetsp:Transcript_25160/g.70129  ORF Transcript_25160/g.70129 Transcript_25160/m.70129 type:complete len:221 (+) Transcript_25160:380-1042(+)
MPAGRPRPSGRAPRRRGSRSPPPSHRAPLQWRCLWRRATLRLQLHATPWASGSRRLEALMLPRPAPKNAQGAEAASSTADSGHPTAASAPAAFSAALPQTARDCPCNAQIRGGRRRQSRLRTRPHVGSWESICPRRTLRRAARRRGLRRRRTARTGRNQSSRASSGFSSTPSRNSSSAKPARRFGPNACSAVSCRWPQLHGARPAAADSSKLSTRWPARG